jgi:hypothetical protein
VTEALGALVLDVVPRLALEAKAARAELRQLEQEVGRSASADGQYWLRRTAALEMVAAAARAENPEWVRAALLTLDQIPVPACNPADHAAQALGTAGP